MILSVNMVQILTVNQVFDILLQWISTRDWEDALRSVMPKRKMLLSQTPKGTASVGVESILDDARSHDDSLPPGSEVMTQVPI